MPAFPFPDSLVVIWWMLIAPEPTAAYRSSLVVKLSLSAISSTV